MTKTFLYLVIGVLILMLFFLNWFKANYADNPATYTDQLTQTQTPAPSPDETKIRKLILDFYNSYESCMKNPPGQASGKAGEYCRNNTGLTTKEFPENLERGGTAKAGTDPVVCAQDLPQNLSVGDISFDAHVAWVSITENFAASTITPEILAVNDNGVWKVDNIVCPQP